MGGTRRNKRDKKSGNGKMKTSNRNTNKQNEKPERTDDSGTPSQDDREDSTQHLSLEEAEKNKSDHDMSPNEKEGKEKTDDSGTPSQDDREDSTQHSSLEEAEKNKSDHDMSPNEKEGKEMEALGENDGNDDDDHCGKKPFETPRSEVCEVENSDRRNNHLNNKVNEGTESNNEQSTSEEGKSSKAEISTKYDDANKIEITVTSGAKSDDVDPSPQSFQTSETELDSIDTEEQHRDNNTIKIEKGKQADHNRMDKIESQTEHMNMDANQQNAEDGERTNDIAMTQSNNDQTTPEEDQPKHMERTAESIGVNGEKTVVGVSPLQSFQTGHIKDDQMDGTEGRHQHGHVDGIEERHQHVDGTEEQHQHRHVNSDVEQQNGQNAMFQDDNTDGRNNNPRNNVKDGTESNNDQSTSEEGKSRKAEITTESDGANKIETTVTSDANSDDPSQQSFQTSETNHDGTDTEEQHRDNNTIKIEEGKQADRNRVDETESQTEHEHMNMDANQQKGEDGGITNDIAMTQSNNDQTTPEKDQPIHMERTTESIGVNEEKIGVSPSQSFHTGDIKDNQMNNDSTSTKTDTCYTEDEPMSSHSSEYGTDRGSDETPSSNASLNPQNKSRGILEEDTSIQPSDVVREPTVVVSDAKSVDDSPSQSFQNENIEHDNINSEEMQRSASLTTIDSPNSSITTTHVQEQPFRAFGDDAGDPGLRNGELSLYENETENDNVVNADNFENEMDSPQSSESGNDMVHYEGSNETLGYNLLSDIQLKTSQEKEIEKLQRELNIKNENLVTLQEEMKRRDEIINEKNSENADLLHRCVASETSAEAADDLREQCEDKNHQIETLEGDLASVRNENESLKRHLEETENVAAYNQRLIDENKSLNEYLEQERQSSAALKEEAQALKEQITNKEDVLKELKSQIKKAIEEKKELGAKLASRNENNSDLLSNNLEMKKKEEELAAELKKMQENYQYEKRRSEELSGQLSLKNKEVTTTENKYKQEIEELKAKYKTEKDQAEKEKELLKQRVTKLTEGSQQLQAENKRIKDDLQLKSMECGNLKSERLRITNQSREVSGKNTSAESNDVLREDVVVETTVVASDANSGDDYTSQSVQNENIDHSNINSEEMQRSASLTTIESPNTSITTTLVQGQPSGAFVDDVGDPGLRNGELSLYEHETENDNVVNADNFENEMDSPQSSESRNDMAHYEGSNEILSYNLLSDIQLKTSQEKEIEKLQRELNIKNENLVTLQEEMKRRDEIINEKNSENADLLHRCVASETSAEAADDLREQCEDKNHQIETLEGDLASVRNENESLKRHLEETENVAADHQRLIEENKILNEYLEQERQSSAALKKETQALEEQITNKEDVLKELESQIKKAIEEKEELGAKLASQNENNSDLLSKYLEMKKKDEEMAAELKKMQENYQYEKRRSEELSGQLSLKNKEVTTTVNKYEQEMGELKAKYKTEKDQAEKEKELLKQRVTKLTEGSQQLQAENKRIKDDLQLKLMECGNLKSERLRITGELDAAKKEIAELSNDRDKLGAYITTVNDEVRQLRAALELKEAEKNAANECMQKVVREKQEMMYSMGNLQRIELENHQLKRQNMGLSEQITKLHASLQEYGLLRDHIQEYYKAFQDSQMELEREKEKSRHINELLSKTGYRLDSMASELNNYRTTTEGYRRSLEEEKEKSNKLERKLDRLTIDNEKLTEERDKCEQKSFEFKDECRSLREDLEKSQAECRDLLSQTQEGASDGTTSLLQGNYFTSTPMGNGFGKPSSQSNFAFGIGGDKINRKK